MENKGKMKTTGLWVKTDKNGNLFLSGKDKESGVVYFVFSDKEDPKKRRLCSSKGEEGIVTLGNLEKRVTDKGEFLVCGDFLIFENRYYEEGTKKPEYVIKLP